MAETTGLVLAGLGLLGFWAGPRPLFTERSQTSCLHRSEEGLSFLIHQGSFSLLVTAGCNSRRKTKALKFKVTEKERRWDLCVYLKKQTHHLIGSCWFSK